MAKKKVAEEKSNTRMTTQQLLKQSGSPDVPHSMDLLDRPGLNQGTAFTPFSEAMQQGTYAAKAIVRKVQGATAPRSSLVSSSQVHILFNLSSIN